jgi:ABC-type nickel/cobalt efflux system permease component RcnA
VPGLDEWIARLGLGAESALLALGVALLLGLRHATDPDHLTAVSTLVLSDARGSTLRSAELGFAWGLGHAATLVAFGLPLVLFGNRLPPLVQQAAELAIGFVVAGLAARLLIRWRRGRLHVHAHTHGELRHAHPHVHEERRSRGLAAEHAHPEAHEHAHAEALGRTPLAAFGVGLVHGVGGSGAVSLLLVAAVPDRALAAGALGLFAAGTALSMSLVSAAFGQALGRGPLARAFPGLVPALGAFSLLRRVVRDRRARASAPVALSDGRPARRPFTPSPMAAGCYSGTSSRSPSGAVIFDACAS